LYFYSPVELAVLVASEVSSVEVATTTATTFTILVAVAMFPDESDAL
jgi:hypothetical protein